MDIDEFVNDYNKLEPIDTILKKYNISSSTYFRILKQNGLKRIISTKISRLLGYSITNNKPKEPIEIIKVEDNIKPIITKKPPKKKLETVQLDKNEDPYDDIITELNNKPDDEIQVIDDDFLTNRLNISKQKLINSDVQLNKAKKRQGLKT